MHKCHSIERGSNRGEGAIGCNETSRHSSEHRASKKVELLTANPLLSKLVSTYSQANFQKRNLLPFYGISSSDENESDDNDDDLQLKKRQLKTCTASETESSSKKHLADVKQNSRSAKLQRLRKQLHAELLGVRKTIISHNKDVKQSDEALRLLMTAVKTNPALTTSAIHNENNYVMSIMEYIQTSRGNRKLLFEGYVYVLDKKKEESAYWRCERRKDSLDGLSMLRIDVLNFWSCSSARQATVVTWVEQCLVYFIIT
ncbi:uncharacterized protein LOC114543609 [Dendronephthya gigantea]|uniref:uncharacterized protein LOC114543609 n=1 Tax=Dendronephthya gigantea TaxID=151771 RepID=UPI00106D9CB2|nr:uncharacterized protein LOC114543609 [Dendronephthya gigantea]